MFPEAGDGIGKGFWNRVGADQVTGRVPDIVDRIVKQDVIIGLAALEDGLATGNVAVEFRQIMPEAALRSKVNGGVKLPPRPRGIGGRVRNAMKEDVIHTGEEEIVGGLFDFRERSLEMFGEPGK